MQHFDVKVSIVQKSAIRASIYPWWRWMWWSVTADPDKLIWYLDPATNIWYDTPGWNIIANPWITSMTPPNITGWYWIFVWTAVMGVDLIDQAVQWNIAFYLSWRKTEDNWAVNLQAHIDNVSNPHDVTKVQVWLGNADNTSDADKPVSTAAQTALDDKADLIAWKVPASQLPSFVDDVEEYANLSSFPVTWETGKIYLALDTNLTYRWSWSVYVQLSEAEWWSITGLLSNQTDLKTALDLKVNVLTPTVALTEITFLADRIHGLFLTPITWNITATTTAGVAWVVCHVLHNQATAPTITGATRLSGEYVVSTLNFIQFMFDGTTVFYTITPNA